MPKKAAKNKTVLPDPLPSGEILTDITKKKWVLGTSIGVGGFGEIYCAAEYTDGKKPKDFPYAIKIEPHDNGPLFCEMHFFMRNAKPEMIKAWCSKKNISKFGMPRLLGTGSHEYKSKKYRFLVMDKYGSNLWSIFLKNNNKFPLAVVYRISLQILDVLEYIHNNDYVHADIKGSNLLLGITKETKDTVYLVDFGLACRYSQEAFKRDPKKAHNGTIEYTSRDAHDGVSTRRGDLEILAYNMIHWAGCALPWADILNDPVAVQASKNKAMSDVPKFLANCFGKRPVPPALRDFVTYVSNMQHNTAPDYKKCHQILLKGLTDSGGKLTDRLDFGSPDRKRKSEIVDDSATTPEKKSRSTPKRGAKSKSAETPSEQVDSSPARKPATPKRDSMENATAEMLRIKQKLLARKQAAKKPARAKKTVEKSKSDSDIENGDIIEATPPQINTKKRKTARKLDNNSDIESDSEPTSRTLRQKHRK